MPNKNLSSILAVLGLTLAVDVNAAPIISPFAADLASGQYSADLSYPGTSAQAAFNGGVWNAVLTASTGSRRIWGAVKPCRKWLSLLRLHPPPMRNIGFTCQMQR